MHIEGNTYKKYGLKLEDLKNFVDTFWYGLLENNKESIQIQAVVLDKRYYNETTTSPLPFRYSDSSSAG